MSDGFQVLAAEVVGGEWQLAIQTAATVVGCIGCGVRAELHGRRTVRVRDLPIGGRPVVLGPAVDQACRRTQQTTLGHRGRKHARCTASASCC